jgi:N-acetylglucosamine kinase-like BadF-type ATPase
MSLAVLAIDGGNSKTDVALIDDSGDCLAHVRGPGSSPHALGIDGCVALLEELVGKAVAQAGLDGHRGVARHASIYLAGADIPAETAVLEQAIRARSWTDDVVVDNDTFALLRAGTDDHDAIAVVCGAGINCVGVTAAGGSARFPSLGRISGDWGGGVQIGDEALWWAARATDGRSEPTALVDVIVEHFGADSLQAVIEDLHFGRLRHSDLGSLSPLVLQTATQTGDPVAVRIVHRQAQEVVLLAVAALRRLDLIEAPATVVLGGGVLTSRDPLLHEEIRRQLGLLAPRAVPVVTEAAPIVGAALLGLEHLGMGPGAQSRVKATLVV